MDVLTHIRSHRASVLDYRTAAEYFAGPYLKHAWLRDNLLDSVGGNHLIATDVLNGHGDFQIDADPFFTNISGAWTIAGGKASFSNALFQDLSVAARFVVGKTYEFIWNVDSVTGAGMRILCGTTAGTIVTSTGVGIQQTMTCAGNGSISIRGLGGATCTIDNLTIREVYNGNIGPDGAVFNGVSNSLQTTRSIDLTAYDKVCLLMDLKFLDYNLLATKAVFESSVSFSVNAGSISAFTMGAVANDPLRLGTRGNVGINGRYYYPTETNLIDKNRKSSVFIYDYSKIGTGGAEANYIQDGILQNPTQYSASNNTGNFGNHILYFGATAGTTAFANIAIKDVALIAGRTDFDWADYYAWKTDMRNPHFFSLYNIPSGFMRKIRETL